MQRIKQHKEKIMNWLLIMIGVSLPFPDYSLVSKALLASLFFWLFFYNSWQEKKQLLNANKKVLMSVTSLFLLFVFGITYTDNLQAIPKETTLKIVFLVVPLMIFSIQINRQIFETIYKYFSYSVALNSASAFVKVLIFKHFHLGNYLVYHDLSLFIEKHTTYYAMLVVLSALYFIWQILVSKNRRITNILLFIFSVFTLYMISNRISIVAMAVSSILLIISKLNKTKSLLYIFISIGFSVLILNLPNYKKRFNPDYLQNTNEVSLRKILWQSVLETAKHNNIIFGTGSESKRDFLYQKYLENGLKIAYVEKYNAHNQYLEYLLDFGLVGVLLLLILLGSMTIFFYKKTDFLALGILSVFVVFMLTESILERQTGIITFTFFISILLRINLSSNKRIKD